MGPDEDTEMNFSMADEFTDHAGHRYLSFRHPAMHCLVEIRGCAEAGGIHAEEWPYVAEEAFEMIMETENRLSVFRQDSQIAYVNHHAAEEPVRVAPDIFELLLFCRQICHETNGAFDPTIGPLLRGWGFYGDDQRVPPPDRQSLAELVGMDNVVLNPADRTVQFARPGILLDLGGIGKGWALDKAAAVLQRYGVTTALLSAGSSSVVALGCPPDETGWTVRLRNPYNTDTWLDEITLGCPDGMEALSTSGNNENFRLEHGKKYGHLFHPGSGIPATRKLSVTTIAATGMQSEALSTALFVMGTEEARHYIDHHPEFRVWLFDDFNE